MPVQALFQACRGPLTGSILPLVGNAADQFPHLAENGLKFLALLPSAAQQAANLQAPVVACPFGYEHGHDKSHDGQDAEGSDEESSRLGFAASNKAQVVQQDGETHFWSPPDGHDADMDAARGQGGDAVPFLQDAGSVSVRIGRANPGPRGPTVEVVRESWGAGQRLEVDIANGRAHYALVARQGDELFLKILGVS